LLTQADAGSAVPRVGFTLEFDVQGGPPGAQAVDAESVLRAWREGLSLVPLIGGGWAEVPRGFLDVHGAKVADLLAARDAAGTVANHALPQLAELCDALECPKPVSLEKLKPLVEGFTALGAAQLPAGLSATLRPYQLQGVAWLQFLQRAGLGGVLADDMGLGKTLQAICALGKGALVVCPTSVLPNWAAELARFRPGLEVSTFHGPSRALDESADVTLTTYAVLRLDEAVLTQKRWSAVVLDEAQAIKNPDSQTARAAFKLLADFRLALSGTPIENRLEELWSVMQFANPGLLGPRRDFDERFARPIADGRTDVAQALRGKLKAFVLRRLKKEVAPELPPRTEDVLYVALEERERAVYDAVLAATKAEVVALFEKGGGVMAALEALLRLRQAACHAGLVPGQQAKSSSKVRTLVETLVTAAADGHRALVFSQWTSLLDFIEPELAAAGLGFVRLDGSTADRAGVTAKFQADDGPPVMLISLKAGGTGLNLTAADHVFLVDPWWNPATEAQAADRAHRIGQTRPVFVHRLVAQGTVEERILTLQEKKRALFEAALGEASGAASLGKADLLELLGL
jgi:SNF2 family DNA or RNA helicase